MLPRGSRRQARRPAGPSRWAVPRPVHLASGVARSAWRSKACPGGSTPTVWSCPAILRAWRRASRNSARSAARSAWLASHAAGSMVWPASMAWTYSALAASSRRRRSSPGLISGPMDGPSSRVLPMWLSAGPLGVSPPSSVLATLYLTLVSTTQSSPEGIAAMSGLGNGPQEAGVARHRLSRQNPIEKSCPRNTSREATRAASGPTSGARCSGRRTSAGAGAGARLSERAWELVGPSPVQAG